MIVRELVAVLGFKTDKASIARAEGTVDKLKVGLGRLTGLVAGAGLVVGFRKVIDLASEAAEASNKFGAVFGSASDTVQSSLDDTSKRTGIASLQLQQFASNIGAIVKPALGSADAAGKVGATMAELALDIASFNDARPDEALVALRSGLIGSAEPLQRFGVDVRVAALEQEALRLGINGSIDSLTEAQRIQIRTSAILRQLGAQGALGDATRTSREFANASRALASQLKQLGATIGSFLLKDAGRTVAIYTRIVTSINAWLEANRELIQQRVDQVLQVINNSIEGAVRVLAFAVDGWRQLGRVLGPVGSSLLLITGIVLALTAILGAPVVLLLAISAAIGLVIDDLVVFADGGESAFGLLLEKLREFLGGFDGVGELFDKVLALGIELWNDWFGAGLEIASDFGADLLENLKALWEKIVGVWDNLTTGFFVDAVEKVREILAGPIGRILVDILGAKAGATIGEFVGKLIGKLVGMLTGKGIVGRAIGAVAGEKVLGALGKITGGIAGGILADLKIGQALPDLLGVGAGGPSVPVAPPAGGGGRSLTTGGNSISMTINGGEGSPRDIGREAASQVRTVLEDDRRQAFNQLTLSGG